MGFRSKNKNKQDDESSGKQDEADSIAGVYYEEEKEQQEEDIDSNLGADVVNTSYEFGENAIYSLMAMAGDCGNLANLVLQSDEVKTVQDEGSSVADLIVTMSRDISGFDGNWTPKHERENLLSMNQAVEVDYDGNKDTIVTSHPIEASFLDPADHQVESVHVVPVALPKKSKKSKPELTEQDEESSDKKSGAATKHVVTRPSSKKLSDTSPKRKFGLFKKSKSTQLASF